MRTRKLTGGIVAIGMALLGCGALATSASAAPGPPAKAPDADFSAAAPLTSAASGCTSNGPTVTDYRGVRYGTRNCHNYRSGVLGFDGGLRTGYLYAGTNWFVCQQRDEDENPPVGNARNNIWLYTQGDVAYDSTHRGWGWFPATYVSGGGNYDPIPGLRWC